MNKNPLSVGTDISLEKGDLNAPLNQGGVTEGRGGFGFTLVETLVVVGTIGLLITAVGGIMINSYKAKNSSEALGWVQNRAVVIMDELKKNVLDAATDSIVCPIGVGQSISFETKSGGHTILSCTEVTSKIASESAENGTFTLNEDGVKVWSCDDFVSCTLNSRDRVQEVIFVVDLGTSGTEENDRSYNFRSTVAPR